MSFVCAANKPSQHPASGTNPAVNSAKNFGNGDIESKGHSPRVGQQDLSLRKTSKNNRLCFPNRCAIKCVTTAILVGVTTTLAVYFASKSNSESTSGNNLQDLPTPVPTPTPTFSSSAPTLFMTPTYWPTAAPTSSPTIGTATTGQPTVVLTKPPTYWLTAAPTSSPTIGTATTGQPTVVLTEPQTPAQPTIAPTDTSGDTSYSDAASYTHNLVNQGLMTIQCGEREDYATYFSVQSAEDAGCLEQSDNDSIIFNCSAEQPRSQMYMNANNPRAVEIKTLDEIKDTIISYTFEITKREGGAEFWLAFEVHGVTSTDVGQAFALGVGGQFMVINQTFGDNTGEAIGSGIAPEINTPYEATMEFLGDSIKVQVTNLENNEILFDETHVVNANLPVIVKGLQSYLRDDFDNVEGAKIEVKYSNVMISGNAPSYLY